MKLLLIMILVTSCGKKLEDLLVTNVEIDPRTDLEHGAEFIEYLNVIKGEYKEVTGNLMDLSDIPVNFGPQSGGTIGVCLIYKGEDTYKEIRVEREFWEQANESQRYLLLKHEIGHCALDKSHDNSTLKGISLSIMNSHIINDAFYDMFSQGYNEELFTGNGFNLVMGIYAL